EPRSGRGDVDATHEQLRIRLVEARDVCGLRRSDFLLLLELRAANLVGEQSSRISQAEVRVGKRGEIRGSATAERRADDRSFNRADGAARRTRVMLLDEALEEEARRRVPVARDRGE